MGKLFLVMGKSSAGKDTAIKIILENRDPDWKIRPISRMTTRPMRPEEKDARFKPYSFVSDKQFDQRINAGNYLPVEEHHVDSGVWRYTSKKESISDTTKINFIATASPSNLKDYIDAYGGQNIVALMVGADPDVRLTRSFARFNGNCSEEDAVEICRRFVKDHKDFNSLYNDTLLWEVNVVMHIENNNQWFESTLLEKVKSLIK